MISTSINLFVCSHTQTIELSADFENEVSVFMSHKKSKKHEKLLEWTAKFSPTICWEHGNRSNEIRLLQYWTHMVNGWHNSVADETLENVPSEHLWHLVFAEAFPMINGS